MQAAHPAFQVPAVQQAMNTVWQESYGGGTNRKEIGFFIVPTFDAQGRQTYRVQRLENVPSPASPNGVKSYVTRQNACEFWFKIPQGLPTNALYIHTHPFKRGDQPATLDRQNCGDRTTYDGQNIVSDDDTGIRSDLRKAGVTGNTYIMDGLGIMEYRSSISNVRHDYCGHVNVDGAPEP